MTSGGFSKRFLGFRLGEADIRLIRIFCIVAQSGGFSAAQAELQMSMPAISRAVAGLEGRLDVKLCTRGRRGFLLTEAGEQVIEMSERLLSDLDRFEREMRHMHQSVSGKIHIGLVDCVLTHPEQVVTRLFERLRQAAPRLDVQITITRLLDIEEGVSEGRFDAGIVFARARQSRRLFRFRLYDETSNLYCAPHHKLAAGISDPADLSEHDYAGFTFVQGGPRAKYSQFLRRTATVNHIEALGVLIATGRYIGFLPDHYVAATPALARAIPVLPKLFGNTTPIHLVMRAAEPSALGAILTREAKALLSG